MFFELEDLWDYVEEIRVAIAEFDAPDLGWVNVLPYLGDQARAILEKAIDLDIPYEEVAQRAADFFEEWDVEAVKSFAPDIFPEAAIAMLTPFASRALKGASRIPVKPVAIGLSAAAVVGACAFAGYRYFMPKVSKGKEEPKDHGVEVTDQQADPKVALRNMIRKVVAGIEISQPAPRLPLLTDEEIAEINERNANASIPTYCGQLDPSAETNGAVCRFNASLDKLLPVLSEQLDSKRVNSAVAAVAGNVVPVPYLAYNKSDREVRVVQGRHRIIGMSKLGFRATEVSCQASDLDDLIAAVGV